MKIKSVLSKTITSLNLTNADVINKYISELEIPKNIFSNEYRELRQLELELIRYHMVLNLLDKYQEQIKYQQSEVHYFRDSEDTVIIINIFFYKKKAQRAFEKELEDITDSKRKLKKELKKKKKNKRNQNW